MGKRKDGYPYAVFSPGRAVVVETDEHDVHGRDLTQVAVDLRTRRNLDGKVGRRIPQG